MSFYQRKIHFTEAVVWICSVEELYLEISENSHECTCARKSFLMKLQVLYRNQSSKSRDWFLHEACNFIKKEFLAQVYSFEYCKISKITFFREHFQWLFCSEMFIISTQPLLIATPSFLLLKHHLRDYDIKFVKLPCNFILYSFSLSLIFVLHYLKEIFTLARREILSILLYMYTYIIE